MRALRQYLPVCYNLAGQEKLFAGGCQWMAVLGLRGGGRAGLLSPPGEVRAHHRPALPTALLSPSHNYP